MLRVLVVAIAVAGCGAAPEPAASKPQPEVLLRYRLREGDRFYTEVQTVRVGPPSVQIVVRARTDVGEGLRLRSALVGLSARLDGVPVDGRELAAAEMPEQRVTRDRRRVVTEGETTTPFGGGVTRLPARAVPVGGSWEERRGRTGVGTSLWVRETLVALEGGTGVIALQGTIRTELEPRQDGLPRAVVSRISGQRRIDLASAWVGRTELEIVTAVQVGRSAGPPERSRIVLRVSRAPFADASESPAGEKALSE